MQGISHPRRDANSELTDTDSQPMRSRVIQADFRLQESLRNDIDVFQIGVTRSTAAGSTAKGLVITYDT